MFKLARHYNWLIFQVINPALKKRLQRYAKGRLLDIGCGEKPYREMAAPYVQEHIGVDHKDTQHDSSSVDIFATAYSIPAEDCSFDTALCTDVLEHLEEPKLAIAEAFRVLRPGAYAIYTVPLFWHLHEKPRDFYRYTKYGLKYLFESNGFNIVDCHPVSGFWVTVALETSYYLSRFRRGGVINPLWWLIPPVTITIQAFAFILNFLDWSSDFTVEYILVARKPKTPGS